MLSVLGKAALDVRDALAWRIRRLVGDRRIDQFENRAVEMLAWRWRRLLNGPVYIGITGSAGKTTTKELLLGVLSQKGRAVGNPGSHSTMLAITRTVLRLRPSHRYFVSELTGHNPKEMDQPLALVRPSIGIVTVIGDDHSSAAYPREAIAREKSKLIASLPATGTAVLNADDALVLAMASNCAAKVITYGIGPNAELRAEDITAAWPDRLQMTLVRGAQRVRLSTQLCGSHWIPSVLGAVGGGLAAGMTLDECAAGIATVAPFEGRMQPVSTPEGVTFIRDDFKAPLYTVDACFEFMESARAKRKIIVIGMLSDVGPDKGAKYAKTATRAQQVADITVFVGPWASSVLKSLKPGDERRLRVFGHVRDAAEYINANTRDGDLVLLKGTNKQDHLLRIILARANAIACWRDDCALIKFCNDCSERTRPSGIPASVGGAPEGAAHHQPSIRQPGIDPDEHVIVGLGNPEPRYIGTPHNIGYEVVDRIAQSLGLAWELMAEAWIARGSAHGQRVCLLKVRAAMNTTGAKLKQLSESLSFDPEQCILVHDDLDLPIGSVRNRMSGGAGGHRGVASILEAFQTDAFRRIKVGVAQAGATNNRLEYVLTAFDAGKRAAVDQAIATARARTLEMVERHRTARQH